MTHPTPSTRSSWKAPEAQRERLSGKELTQRHSTALQGHTRGQLWTHEQRQSHGNEHSRLQRRWPVRPPGNAGHSPPHFARGTRWNLYRHLHVHGHSKADSFRSVGIVCPTSISTGETTWCWSTVRQIMGLRRYRGTYPFSGTARIFYSAEWRAARNHGPGPVARAARGGSDGDGDPDFVVSGVGHLPQVLENQVPGPGEASSPTKGDLEYTSREWCVHGTRVRVVLLNRNMPDTLARQMCKAYRHHFSLGTRRGMRQPSRFAGLLTHVAGNAHRPWSRSFGRTFVRSN